MIFMIFLTVSIATEPEALGLALTGVLPDRGTTAKIRTVKETWKGAPQRLLWQGLLSCELMSTPAAGIQHFFNQRTFTTQISVASRSSTLGYRSRMPSLCGPPLLI
jgi:hypothetical protein